MMIARLLGLIALCVVGVTNIQASEESKQPAAQDNPSKLSAAELNKLCSMYKFTTDTATWERFLEANPVKGTEEYFLKRRRVINSLKGKPATKENVVAFFKVIKPPYEYELYAIKVGVHGNLITDEERTLLSQGKKIRDPNERLDHFIAEVNLTTHRPKSIIVEKK